MHPRTPLSILIAFLLVCAFITVMNFSSEKATASRTALVARSKHDAMPPPQDFPTPPTKITSALAAIPVDSKGIPTQGNLDLYSWLTFIALNWPASTTTCAANVNLSILSGQGPVVWETYLSDSDVFVAPPAKPSAWCPQTTAAARSPLLAGLAAPLQRLVQRKAVRKIVVRQSKAAPDLATNFPGIEEAVGGVLTEQSDRFGRLVKEHGLNPSCGQLLEEFPSRKPLRI